MNPIFALVVMAIIGGKPQVLPVSPHKTMAECVKAKAEIDGYDLKDEVQYLGTACIELKPNEKV